MNLARAQQFGVPLFAASAITFLLFWTMTLLIQVEDVEIRPDPIVTIETVNVRLDTEAAVKVRPVPKRPKSETAPTPPPFGDPATGRTIGIPFAQVPTGEAFKGRPGHGLLRPAGEAVPLVRVPPEYPAAALRRGLEGRVLVEFDLTASGAVENARVVAAEPTRTFDEAALRAIRQWRYDPKIENGQARPQSGLRISIPFRMDGQGTGKPH